MAETCDRATAYWNETEKKCSGYTGVALSPDLIKTIESAIERTSPSPSLIKTIESAIDSNVSDITTQNLASNRTLHPPKLRAALEMLKSPAP